MAYLGTPPQSGFITTAKQRVTSSTNNYVDLDHAISSIADVIVFVNFVKQDTTNLTLTTSTRITLGATLVSSDIVEIHYLGKAVNTQTPATGTVTNDMLAGSIGLDKLSATGTKSSSTFLRGDNTFATAGISGITSSSSSTAINIATNGEVTKPLNPAFRVYQDNNTDYATNHTMYNQNITEVYDVNGDMGTNGSFTAPVTGKYLFTMSIYDINATENTAYDMMFITSNRNYRWGFYGYFRDNYTGNTNFKTEGHIIVDMDASDTAYVKNGANVTITNGSNSEHSYFSGILIG